MDGLPPNNSDHFTVFRKDTIYQSCMAMKHKLPEIYKLQGVARHPFCWNALSPRVYGLCYKLICTAQWAQSQGYVRKITLLYREDLVPVWADLEQHSVASRKQPVRHHLY